MSDEVVIEHRFRGPPESANGGYTCGVLAAHLDPTGPAEVTLRQPPPLDRPLAVDAGADGARLTDGDSLVAEAASAAAPAPELPAPVSLEDARGAREHSHLHDRHPFPECFVCGPERARHDGLLVTCGPVEGRDVVAAPFETDPEMAGADGTIRDEIVWAVLDCPSGIAAMLTPEIGISVLGRLRTGIRSPLEAGRDYVAVGWPIERDGRKLRSATAIFGEGGGEPLAVSEATWIELRDQPGDR